MADVQLRLLIDVIGDASRSLGQIENALKQIESAAKQAATSTAQVGRRGSQGLARFEAGLRTVETRLKAVRAAAQAMVGAGAQLAATGAILTAAAVFPIKRAADFQKQMSSVRAVTAGTTEDFQAMREEAKRLGRETAFTATQAAEGLELLGRAGFNARDATAALEPTLLLAAAGGISLAESADIATNVLQGMGLPIKDLTRVTDVLAATSANANTDILGLGQAMSFVAPAAAATGVEIEVASAALGVLGDAGIKATRAGTALRGILTRLVDPKIQRKLKELGLQVVKTADGNIDLVKTFELIGAAVEKRTFGLAEATELFGRNFSTAAIAMAKANKKLGELSKSNEKAEGTTKSMARIMLDNLGGAITLLLSALDGLATTLGEPLLGPMKELIGAITNVVSSITKWVKENQSFATGIIVFVGVLGGIITVLGTLLLAIGGTTLAVSLLATGVVKFLIQGTLFIKFLTTAEIATTALSVSVKGLAISLGTVIAAILIFMAAWDLGRIISNFEVFGQTVGQWVQLFFLWVDQMVIKWRVGLQEMIRASREFVGLDTSKQEKEIKRLVDQFLALEKTKQVIKDFRTEAEKQTTIFVDAEGAAKSIQKLIGLNQEFEAGAIGLGVTQTDFAKRAEENLKKVHELAGEVDNTTRRIETFLVEVNGEMREFSFIVEEPAKKLATVADNTKKVADETNKATTAVTKMEEKSRAVVQLFKDDKSLTITPTNLDAIKGEIEELLKPQTKVITIKTVRESAEGGPVGLAGGGRLPGYGGGDRIRALLEAGEYVIRKEAVKKYGAGFLSAVNEMSLRLAQIPQIVGARMGGLINAPRLRYQTGGGVGSLAAQNLGVVQLGVGERSFPVVSRVDTLTELKDALRRENLLRSN